MHKWIISSYRVLSIKKYKNFSMITLKSNGIAIILS